MVTFHIDEESARKLDEAYQAHTIDSKDNVVALAAAIGIARERKKELKSPVVFRQSFADFDRFNMLSLNAINKNLAWSTRTRWHPRSKGTRKAAWSSYSTRSFRAGSWTISRYTGNTAADAR
jgi:hypothetical protein